MSIKRLKAELPMLRFQWLARGLFRLAVQSVRRFPHFLSTIRLLSLRLSKFDPAAPALRTADAPTLRTKLSSRFAAELLFS